MVKFVHTSDWHLGIRLRSLHTEAEPRFRQERLDAVRRIGVVASEERCDFIVVAGDILHSNQVDQRTIAQLLEVLRELPVDVYLLPGNHDAADAGSVLCGDTFRQRCPGHVHVLNSPGVVEVMPNVEVVAAPLTTRHPLSDLVRGACEGLQPGPTRIVLGHGMVDRLSPDADQPNLIDTAHIEELISSGCVHYVALGDRHSTTRIGDSGRVWYAGTPEPTAFDEIDPGQALLVSIDETSVEVERRQVGRWSFRRVQFAFAGDDDVDRFAVVLREIVSKERTVLRLALEGTLTLQGQARLDSVMTEAEHAFAGLTISPGRSDLAVIPEPGDIAELQLAGFARAAADELLAAASSGVPEAEVATDALGLLVRLAQRTP